MKTIPYLVLLLIINVYATAFSSSFLNDLNCSNGSMRIDTGPILSLTGVLNNPKKYNGKVIRIQCYYYESNEKVVLASDIVTHEGGWRYVKDGVVWVYWGIKPPLDLLNKLNRLPGIGGEYDLYGRVVVQGVFKVGEGFGHLGEYKYAFTIKVFCIPTDRKRPVKGQEEVKP